MEEIGFSIPISKVIGDLTHRRVRLMKKGNHWLVMVAISENPVRKIAFSYKHSDPAIAERSDIQLGFTKTELEVINSTWSRGEFKHWVDRVISWLLTDPTKYTPSFDPYITITSWRKREKDGGKMWSADHSNGPGYYSEAVLDKIYSTKFADND